MIVLNVEGMSCDGCRKAVANAVKRADPQAACRVDLDSGHVEIDSTEPPEKFTAAIEAAGYDIGAPA